MIKKAFAISMMCGLVFTACKKDKTEAIPIDFVVTTITDKNGNILEIGFEDNNETAVIFFDNDTLRMKRDTVASGLKFSNDDYTYSEWKDNVTLKKGDKTVFTNAEDIVNSSVKNKDGVVLDMIFNNTKGTAEMKLNGETIELKQDTTASGIQYSNDQYKFVEWQGNITLKKGDKVVFESQNK